MILLDTNAIVYYLHRVEPYASKVKEILVEREDLAVTLRIVDEVVFTLIWMALSLCPVYRGELDIVQSDEPFGF